MAVTNHNAHYSQFDWNVTSNENLADIGALQVAYDAWMSLHKIRPDLRLPFVDLSPDQIFFVAVAQVSRRRPAAAHQNTELNISSHVEVNFTF